MSIVCQYSSFQKQTNRKRNLRECTINMPEGGGGEGFTNFSGNKFQETIDLTFSWSSNFFRNCLTAPPINFSFLIKAYLSQYFRVVLIVIFKF